MPATEMPERFMMEEKEKNMKYALSKSRYCAGVQCPKMLWMQKNMPEEFDESVMNESVLETGNRVGDLAMGLFGDYTEVPYGDLKDMNRITDELLQKKTAVICEASFAMDGLFCSVDILVNKGNRKVELYEVKSSTHEREIYEYDISFQYYVLSELGFHVTKACLVHLNNAYVRHGDLDLQQLFTVTDYTGISKKRYAETEANIEYFRQFMRKRKEPDLPVGIQCFSPYQCGYFRYCAGDLPSPNVFDLKNVQPQTKMKYYNAGIVSFRDLQEAGKLKDKPKMQVEYELCDMEDYSEKDNIRNFLKELTYPLYFLDFEAFQPAIPLYDDSFPYEQIPFQYSLHYMKRKNGKLYHKEFLAYPYEDPRRAVAESLCAEIPEDVCVLAYNMSYEKGRIKRMADLYPDLCDHLMSIHDNIKDLMIPFQKRWYYSRGMQGSYSIKYVLPALYPNDPELDYHSLEGVHNGQEASETFSRMMNMEKAELEEYRRYLLKYCELDTYAMVRVLQRLQEAVK